MFKEYIIQKSELIIQSVLFCLAFYLCFQHAEKYAIAGDEPFSIYVSKFNISSIWKFLSEGNNPPLYETILHFWIKMFGISPIAIRLPSILCFAFTCSVLYKIGCTFFTRSIGISAALLLCFSNVAIYISQEGRVYAMFMLLTTLSFYFLLKLIKERLSKLNKVFYVLTLVFLLYAHYLSVFVILSHFMIAVILYLADNKKKAIDSFVLQAISIVLYSPILFVFFKRLGNYRSTSWLGKPDGLNDYMRVLKLFFNNYDTLLVFISGLLLFLLAYLINKKKFPLNYLLVIVLWSIGSYSLNYIISFAYPVWGERYTLFTIPGFYLLLSIIILGLVENKYLRIGLVIVLPILLFLKFNNAISNGREVDKLVKKFKQLKTDSTISYLCPEYAEVTFSFHFDQPTFRTFSNDSCKIDNYSQLLRQKLHIQNIFPIRLSNEMDTIQMLKFKKVLYIDYLADFNNVNNGIRPLIESKYRLVNTYTFWENLHIFEYEK
jgi:uncharacterized membrane protein